MSETIMHEFCHTCGNNATNYFTANGKNPWLECDRGHSWFPRNTIKPKELETLKTFYVSARLDGQGHSPKVKHDTLDSACAEVTRLAKSHIGVEFFVLKVIASSLASQEITVEVTGYSEEA